MEQELEILQIISTGLQGRINDRVYYIVDGKQRSRAYKEPEDPETPAQLALRRVFAALVRRWHALKGDEKNYWNLIAKQSGRKRSTGFNAFMRDGMIKYKAVRERKESASAPEIIKPEKRHTRRFVRTVRHAIPANSPCRDCHIRNHCRGCLPAHHHPLLFSGLTFPECKS